MLEWRQVHPELRAALKDHLGLVVSDHAITDEACDLMIDVGHLAAASKMPGAVTVSAMLCGVARHTAEEISPVKSPGAWRAAAEPRRPSAMRQHNGQRFAASANSANRLYLQRARLGHLSDFPPDGRAA
jgi:hypothetical protein